MVRRNGEGYEVVFGYHRLEACKRLRAKGIKVLIRHFTNGEAFLARVSENLLRNCFVNPIEEAEGYKKLVNEGWTINAIARKIGKCDSYVCERLRLLDKLDHQLRLRVSNGKGRLTPSHAEVLSRVEDIAWQRELAKLVEKKRLSVRALEGLLNGIPLPRKVRVEDILGECVVRIPSEFAKVIGLTVGQYLQLRVHGKKLVLEILGNSMMRKRTVSKDGVVRPGWRRAEQFGWNFARAKPSPRSLNRW